MSLSLAMGSSYYYYYPRSLVTCLILATSSWSLGVERHSCLVVVSYGLVALIYMNPPHQKERHVTHTACCQKLQSHKLVLVPFYLLRSTLVKAAAYGICFIVRIPDNIVTFVSGSS